MLSAWAGVLRAAVVWMCVHFYATIVQWYVRVIVVMLATNSVQMMLQRVMSHELVICFNAAVIVIFRCGCAIFRM